MQKNMGSIPPTIFNKLLEPIDDFVRDQEHKLQKHHNQKFGYYAFFRILMYFFLAEGTSFKLFIVTKLNKGLLPKSLELFPVPYSTANEAFERFSVKLFQEIFQHLLATVPFKSIPELASLGKLYCIDGSVFPVIRSMLWAQYTSTSQALKLHLCLELNRMIAVDFIVTHANSSERNALIKMLKESVTYIADRGYMSFKICHEIVSFNAHFIFRIKKGMLFTVQRSLVIELPEKAKNLCNNLTDELILYTNDNFKHVYRLVCFSVAGEKFLLLTDRQDLTTFQVIMLYAWRWQIELLFRFLKRTMGGIHLIKQDQRGVTIQFYAMLIAALLQLRLKQKITDIDSEDNPPTFGNTVGEKNSSNTDKPDFIETIGQNIGKYWKIGIHWLTALKSLLSEPFDRKAIEILNSS
jgi:hypothetical protein